MTTLCRSADAAGPQPATAAAKRFTLGTHRVCSPEETWQRIEPLLPVAGITRVADVTRLDALGIPVFQAVRPGSRSVSVSQGKGVTSMAARVSAVMEAIELWHAESLAHVLQTVSPLCEMEYANPIRTENLLWLSRTRRLDTLPLAWVRARSLGRGPDAWIPRQMIELDFTLRGTLRPQMFHRTSNGLASGNCLAEAQLHSLCELIERHALFLARADPGRKVAVDPDSVTEGYCRGLLDRLQAAGARLAVFDVTWEAGIPVFFVEMALPDLPRIWGGSGCHPAADVALSRALTETAQSRLTYIAGARDELPEPAGGRDAPALYASFEPPAPARPFAVVPDASADSVEEDVACVVERLGVLGYEPYWVDLTRPEVDIAVTRAFVPGLREALHG